MQLNKPVKKLGKIPTFVSEMTKRKCQTIKRK